jgi:dTDP-4-dehydrorhamnose reductase
MVVRRILVTGSEGQLGQELVPFFSSAYDVVGADFEDCDVRLYSNVRVCVRDVQPDIVIHAAADTDVDECEIDQRMAMAVNAAGTENVARACKEVGAKMVYYSTDYVFDGTKQSPYVETDAVDPKTVYGKSKLEGERQVVDLLDDYVILRIAWLYGIEGQNFVKTMVRLGLEQLDARKQARPTEPLKVVDDQFGNPCWTLEIARQTGVVLANNLTGIFHATSEGETSWYGFARMIFEELNMPVQVRPCPTEEFPRPAPRPKRSSLENKRLKEAGLNIMRSWDIALAEFLDQRGESLKP